MHTQTVRAGDSGLEHWADSQGLLKPVDNFFGEDDDSAPSDVLGLLGSLETVKDVVDRSASGSLGARILSRQADRLQRCALNPELMSIVRAKALQVTASCTAAALRYNAADAEQGLRVVETVGAQLLSPDTDDEFQSAIADSISDMTAHSAAAATAFVTSCPTALRALLTVALQPNNNSSSSPAALTKLTCTHALASLLGAERDLLRPQSAGGPFLGHEGEATFSKCLFEVLREARVTLMDALMESLRRQVVDFHVGAYRLLSTLVRRSWGVMEICSHRDFMNRLLDPASEASRQGAEFRYSVVTALYASVSESSPEVDKETFVLLASMEEALTTSRKQGPFGRGAGHSGAGAQNGSAVPTVLAERRGAGL